MTHHRDTEPQQHQPLFAELLSLLKHSLSQNQSDAAVPLAPEEALEVQWTAKQALYRLFDNAPAFVELQELARWINDARRRSVLQLSAQLYSTLGQRSDQIQERLRHVVRQLLADKQAGVPMATPETVRSQQDALEQEIYQLFLLEEAAWLREHHRLAEARLRLDMLAETRPREEIDLKGRVESARLMREHGQFEDSQEAFRTLLAHPRLGTAERVVCLQNLAFFQRHNGNLEIAEQHVAEAECLAENDMETCGQTLVETKHQRAVLWMLQEAHLPEAQALIEKVLQMRQASDGPEQLDIARSLAVKSGIWRRRGDLVEALEAMLQTVTIYAKTVGDSHPNAAEAICRCADLYKELRLPELAQDFYQRAIQAFENAALTDLEKAVLARCHIRLAQLYAEMERRPDAQVHFEKARQCTPALARLDPDTAREILAFRP